MNTAPQLLPLYNIYSLKSINSCDVALFVRSCLVFCYVKSKSFILDTLMKCLHIVKPSYYCLITDIVCATTNSHINHASCIKHYNCNFMLII